MGRIGVKANRPMPIATARAVRPVRVAVEETVALDSAKGPPSVEVSSSKRVPPGFPPGPQVRVTVAEPTLTSAGVPGGRAKVQVETAADGGPSSTSLTPRTTTEETEFGP